jgi:hypothetical protein
VVLDVGQEGEATVANREFVRFALSQAGQMQAILAGFFPFDPPTLRGQLSKVDFERPTETFPRSASEEDSTLRSTAKEPENSVSR